MIPLDARSADQVTSRTVIDVALIDPSQRLRIISGIACPEFYVNTDDRSYSDECVVSLNSIVTDFIQATCQVGLASIANDETAFRFALNDSWVDLDETSGELKLHVSLEAKGEKTTLARFGFQVVVLYGSRVSGVHGRIYWSRDLLDATPHAHTRKHSHPPVNVTTLVEVHGKIPGSSAPGTYNEIDIGFVAPAGSIHAEGNDFWVEYALEHLPLGVPVRIVGENISSRFGAPVDMTLIAGPNPVTLTPSHLSERVDFRIVRHQGPR